MKGFNLHKTIEIKKQDKVKYHAGTISNTMLSKLIQSCTLKDDGKVDKDSKNEF